MTYSEKIEAAVCRELAKICRKRYSLDKVIELHERAYSHYRTCAKGYGTPVSIIDVAYVNALARYAATFGVQLHEIR